MFQVVKLCSWITELLYRQNYLRDASLFKVIIYTKTFCLENHQIKAAACFWSCMFVKWLHDKW